jgi:Holliday junction resolvase RusA-like endonuclease
VTPPISRVEDHTTRFVVMGRPQGKGSKRVLPIRGRGLPAERIVLVDSNKNARPWAARIAYEAVRAHRQRPLMRGPVLVQLTFFFARPKAHFGRGRNSSKLRPTAPLHMATMPDIDKLARCTLDAFTGTLIKDDSQVTDLTLGKRYGEPERVEVTVIEL